jgi:hypothetical protein
VTNRILLGIFFKKAVTKVVTTGDKVVTWGRPRQKRPKFEIRIGRRKEAKDYDYD